MTWKISSFILPAAALAALPLPALAQTSPALVEQVPAANGAMPQIRARGGSTVSEGISAQPQATSTNPVRPASTETASSAVPREVIEACEGEDNEKAEANGVDCNALLQALNEANRPQPTAEQALLGALRPNGEVQAGIGQRTTNAASADAIARQTGDVQTPGSTDAIGAIVQQGGGPR